MFEGVRRGRGGAKKRVFKSLIKVAWIYIGDCYNKGDVRFKRLCGWWGSRGRWGWGADEMDHT